MPMLIQKRAKIDLACAYCPDPIKAGATFVKEGTNRLHHYCVRPFKLKREEEQWRNAEFVYSTPDWGDRGRMRGSNKTPPKTLHRPSCKTLDFDKRLDAWTPSKVYATTKEEFFRKQGWGETYVERKVCTKCCKDIAAKKDAPKAESVPARMNALLAEAEGKKKTSEKPCRPYLKGDRCPDPQGREHCYECARHLDPDTGDCPRGCK